MKKRKEKSIFLISIAPSLDHQAPFLDHQAPFFDEQPPSTTTTTHPYSTITPLSSPITLPFPVHNHCDHDHSFSHALYPPHEMHLGFVLSSNSTEYVLSLFLTSSFLLSHVSPIFQSVFQSFQSFGSLY